MSTQASTDNTAAADADLPSRSVSLSEATAVWAQIGLMSFGGPAGQIALMHRILVDEKRWISESRFLHALNFCMLLPGPEAQQLATYVGWMLHRVRGGLIAGSLFILPGALVILGLSFVYLSAGDLPIVQALFQGLKPVVIVIVAQAVLRIGSRALRSSLHLSLAIAALIAMSLLQIPFPLVILAAAAIGALAAKVHTGDEIAAGSKAIDHQSSGGGYAHVLRCLLIGGGLWLGPTLILVGCLGGDHVFSQIGVFFSKMAVVTFGGAYAVLAYVSQEAVQNFGWLQPTEMIDGLGLAETTPGPLILVVQFVGFSAAYRDPGALAPGLAGALGALLTLWVTFVPCFLWIFLGAPYMERVRQIRWLSAALAAVTAAVVGVIANLALWFSAHVLFAEMSTSTIAGMSVSLPQLTSLRMENLLLALMAALLIFRWRLSVPWTLLLTCSAGMLFELG